MHRFAKLANAAPIDREAHEAFVIPHKIIQHMGVERRCPGACIDLGWDVRQTEFRQADKLAPANYGKNLGFLQGRITIPSPPSPTFKRRSTVPLA